jgi:F-type H+-transporting ATPase subunit b
MKRLALVSALLIALSSAASLAQNVTPPDHAATAQPSQQKPAASGERSAGQELAEESREAAGEEENAQFKYSPSVRTLARFTGLSPVEAYWVLLSLNFAVVAISILWLAKSKLLSFFKIRNETIRMSMEEARRTSADAQARLGDIEVRLSRIDAEISEMRVAAEREGVREQERIRAAAEEDKAKILATVDQELAAARRVAERSLKAYAAALAVELAERRIQIDPETDRRLVRRFAEDFSADGSA